jgi:hypothetical protein
MIIVRRTCMPAIAPKVGLRGSGATGGGASRRYDNRGDFAAMTQHHITDADYAAALAAGRAQAETEILAQAVRYVPDRDVIEIVTNRNAGFLVPRQ